MKQDNTTVHAFRLKPGEDLKEGIERIVKEKGINAGWVATCAGSLTDYSIRFANQPGPNTGNGHFEIVSLSGTVSINGSHLHISISDSTGKTIGGHLMPGCKIYTTAEIVLESTDKYEFTREKDGSTPWEELQVREIKNKE
ncbi:MAG TPA: PPC domain-containing DNA-binding protein [Chitinophagaceae bacterium]|nr:PPC domain-containing DNA-binding protein [Chitinophagaceae bacterium]